MTQSPPEGCVPVHAAEVQEVVSAYHDSGVQTHAQPLVKRQCHTTAEAVKIILGWGRAIAYSPMRAAVLAAFCCWQQGLMHGDGTLVYSSQTWVCV